MRCGAFSLASKPPALLVVVFYNMYIFSTITTALLSSSMSLRVGGFVSF